MTWKDFHRRQRVLESVLEHARRRPDEQLTLETAPHAHTIFSDTDDLLCALQYKWTQLLTGRIDIALAETGNTRDNDRAEAVEAAWDRTARANPVLRRVLDGHRQFPAAELRVAFGRERRMLALSAAMTDHDDPAVEKTETDSALSPPPHTSRESSLVAPSNHAAVPEHG